MEGLTCFSFSDWPFTCTRKWARSRPLSFITFLAKIREAGPGSRRYHDRFMGELFLAHVTCPLELGCVTLAWRQRLLIQLLRKIINGYRRNANFGVFLISNIASPEEASPIISFSSSKPLSFCELDGRQRPRLFIVSLMLGNGKRDEIIKKVSTSEASYFVAFVANQIMVVYWVAQKLACQT